MPTALAATVPAVLLLAFALSATRAPFDASALPPSLLRADNAALTQTLVQPSSDGGLLAMAHQGQWPIAQTMLIQSPGGPSVGALTSLRGVLETMPPIRGKAPMAGQVSKVSVKVGQSVSVDTPILELSGGPESRANRTGTRAEKRQSAAESAQVQAAGEQAKLQAKMKAAQDQLAASQERVAKAQRRVDAAREVVRRLQRGEVVSASDAEPAEIEQPTTAASSHDTGHDASADPARRKLVAAAQTAQQAAKAAQRKALLADRQAVKMEAKAKAAATASRDAKTAATVAQTAFDAGTLKASDLDKARAAVEDADLKVQWSTSAATNARKAAASQAEAAKSAQAASDAASTAATRSLRDVSVFGGDSAGARQAAAKPTPKAAPKTADGSLSVADAARLANSAVEESETAVAQAKELKDKVDAYSRQVNATRSDLDSSSKQLASAQDAVLDQTIAANLSVVRAPATGVVQSIAAVAQNVVPNDVIVEIAKLDQLRVVWTDTTGAWRKLREDAPISATVNTPGGDRAVTLKISSIEPTGKDAQIEAVLENPMMGRARAWQAGSEVSLSLPVAPAVPAAPTKEVGTNVPEAAVMETNATAGGGTANAKVAVLVPQSGRRMCRVEWRSVSETSRGAGGIRVTGLAPGERIALRPALLPQSAVSLQLVG